jgi:lysophospholipase L1-like esterase
MTKVYKGKKQTHNKLEMLITHLKTMCKEENVVFFDMFAAMGGRNSMINWVEQGLASSDYIHFNREGAEKIADLFYENLILEYELFLRRKDLKNE